MKKTFPYILLLAVILAVPNIISGLIYILSLVWVVLKYLFSGILGAILLAFSPIFLIMLILFISNLFTNEKK
jgi:hypothetical protein